jgi:DNA modification methylase
MKILEHTAKGGLNPLGKNPGDIYDGKFSENAEQYSSPRARRAREEFQNKDCHPKGKNPGDVISERKQDNVPGRNANVYKGFNERWKQRQKVLQDVLEVNSLNELLDAKKKIKQGDVVNYKGRLYRVRRSRANTDYEKTKQYDAKLMPAANMNKLPVMVPLDGKNPGDFWIINTRGFKGAHFAVYPEELLRKPMLSSSQVGDVVLDPFIGSGTTAVVAKKFGRRFLGCDINPEYSTIAENRLRSVTD